MRDQSRARTREGGFSLIELLIAMVITMVIMGAVYGLIAGGQNAFRREPEMAERQQNIRMAMDLIMKDIANAGSGLPTFVQSFTPNLNACAGCPLGPDNVTTDEIEILTNSEARDTEPICRTMGLLGGNGNNIRLIRNLANAATLLKANTVVVPFTASGQWTLRKVFVDATLNATPVFDCTAGNHTAVDLITPDPPTNLNRAGSACLPNTWGNITSPCELVGLSFANVVKYRIRMDTSVPPVPMLERWSSDAPGAIVGGLPVNFQTLARGIENMQVQYLTTLADPVAGWVDSAPVVVSPNYPTLITQVRVTLAARSEAQNIAGATRSQTGGDRIRGTLMSAASPRATLMNITLASPAPVLWR